MTKRLKLVPYIFENYDVIAFGDPAILSQLEQICSSKVGPPIEEIAQKLQLDKIKRNRATCNLCKETIESVHRNDFKFCRCGAIFVDGGKDYLRRGGDPLHITERSTFCGKKKKTRRSSR